MTEAQRSRTDLDLPNLEMTGWGRYPRSRGYLAAIAQESQAVDIWKRRAQRPLLGRGAGRAYGDAAICEGGILLDLQTFDRFLSFDPATGLLHAEAGVTLDQVLRTFVPRGFFLPITPGTKYPTLGGCAAADVHGKSAYPISHYIRRLHMLLADGSRAACSREERPDLFWATLGGMGLTGLILSVELALRPIETSWLCYDGVKAKNLEEVFRLYEEETEHDLSVAWIDCLAQGRSLGRSILMRGHFASKAELGRSARRPLAVPDHKKLIVPITPPSWTLNPLSVAAFNAVIYGKHPQRQRTIMDYDAFFYPLDSILRWNLIYGAPGLLQYQFLIPTGQAFEGMKTMLEAIAKTGKASFLAVLKKFGKLPEYGPISFPTPGYFLALDFPVGNRDILKAMDEWDRILLKFNGRAYLAKDARMRPETFAAMYPRLGEWKRTKQSVDPNNVFASDLGRRLDLAAR